jgi:hypothetical protein
VEASGEFIFKTPVFQLRGALFQVDQHGIVDQPRLALDTSCKGVEPCRFGLVVSRSLIRRPAFRK